MTARNFLSQLTPGTMVSLRQYSWPYDGRLPRAVYYPKIWPPENGRSRSPDRLVWATLSFFAQQEQTLSDGAVAMVISVKETTQRKMSGKIQLLEINLLLPGFGCVLYHQRLPIDQEQLMQKFRIIK